MTTIRFGILGSGFMGRTHAEAIRRLPNAELIAVHGGSRAPGLAESYGATFEADKATLLARTDINAIVVTTPHHLHVEEALAAFAQGKHVLVEKPLATTIEDSDRMIAAAKAHGRALGVGYQQRFRTNNVKACELIRAGVIGTLQTVQISMPMFAGVIKAGGFGGNWAWWNDPASVAHLLNSAPHAVDLVRWFTGDNIVTVSAFCRTFLPDITVEDTTMSMFELTGGTLCSLFSSRALPTASFPREDFRFRIVGTKGLLDLDPTDQLKLSNEDGWSVVSTQPPINHEDSNTAFGDVRMKSYADQMAAFIDLIEGRPSKIGRGEDGRAGVEACVSMLRSSAEKRWVFPQSES
jgi:predicted dehydrogenase